MFNAVVISKLFYASPAWWGFAQASDIARIDAFLRKFRTFGNCDNATPDAHTINAKSEAALFNNICINSHHVLHRLLPPVKLIAMMFALGVITDSFLESRLF
jgi:hypothetical protein